MGVFRTRRTRSAGSGRFHCPSCHTDRAYELVTELEKRVVLARVHRELLGEPLDDDALDAEVRAAEQDGRPAGDYARTIARYLADGEKTTVLRAAMRVASERHLLAEIGAGLGMEADAIRAVVGEAGHREVGA